MRLEQLEIDSIKRAFVGSFLPHDHLWLFGSRVDDTKKGGDIDLYVETQETDVGIIQTMHHKFLDLLFDRIEEQKVDVVIKRPTLTLPIHQHARETGVQLI
jgi:hypothetical protein